MTGEPAPKDTTINVRRRLRYQSAFYDTPAIVQTRADGSFEVPPLPPGSYDFEANATRDKASLYLREIVQLQSAALTDLRLTLKPYASVKGRLRMESNARLPDGRVQIDFNGPSDMRGSQSATLQSDGTFRLDSLIAAEYAVTAWMPEGSSAYLKSAIVSGTPQPLHRIRISAGAAPLEMDLIIAQDGGRLKAEIPADINEAELVWVRLSDIAAGDRSSRIAGFTTPHRGYLSSPDPAGPLPIARLVWKRSALRSLHARRM